MASEKKETILAMGAIPLRWHQRLLKPGLILLAVAVVLLAATRAFPAFWDLLRGEWNERGLMVHWAQQAWVPFALIGGVMVAINRSYAWPNFIVLLVPVVILGFLLYPVFVMHGCRSTQQNCMDNQRQLGFGMLMYAQDHNSTFPNSLKELRVPLTLLKCRGNGSPSGYGLNAHVAGQPVATVKKHPEKVLLTADSVTPNSLLSSPADFSHRHFGCYIATFADAHIEVLRQDVPLAVK